MGTSRDSSCRTPRLSPFPRETEGLIVNDIDEDYDCHLSASPQHFVQITGTLRINGEQISSIRSAELLHMVANEGGNIPRSVLEKALYGGFCSRSSLWYPLKVCQDSGINIYYDKENRSVVLQDTVLFDYDIAINYLRQGKFRAALWVLNGWPFSSSTDPYAELLKEQLQREFLAACPTIYRSEIEDAFDILDAKCLSQRPRYSSRYSCCRQ